jgi:hypothetical protein
MPDLDPPHPPIMRHRRNRWHPSCIEEPSVGEVGVAPPCERVGAVEQPRHLHVYVHTVALRLWLGPRGPILLVILCLSERPQTSHGLDWEGCRRSWDKMSDVLSLAMARRVSSLAGRSRMP